MIGRVIDWIDEEAGWAGDILVWIMCLVLFVCVIIPITVLVIALGLTICHEFGNAAGIGLMFLALLTLCFIKAEQ